MIAIRKYELIGRFNKEFTRWFWIDIKYEEDENYQYNIAEKVTDKLKGILGLDVCLK